MFPSVFSKSGNELYRVVLETALFPTHNDYLDLSPTQTSHQLMTFKSPSAKMRRTITIDSPFRDAYSTSPLSHEAQSILTSLRPEGRGSDEEERPGCFRALDAPGLKVCSREQ